MRAPFILPQVLTPCCGTWRVRCGSFWAGAGQLGNLSGLGRPGISVNSIYKPHLSCYRHLAPFAGPVKLLTDPISAGYVQNPISVYYCYSRGKGTGRAQGKGSDDTGAGKAPGAAQGGKAPGAEVTPRLERCIAEVGLRTGPGGWVGTCGSPSRCVATWRASLPACPACVAVRTPADSCWRRRRGVRALSSVPSAAVDPCISLPPLLTHKQPSFIASDQQFCTEEEIKDVSNDRMPPPVLLPPPLASTRAPGDQHALERARDVCVRPFRPVGAQGAARVPLHGHAQHMVGWEAGNGGGRTSQHGTVRWHLASMG